MAKRIYTNYQDIYQILKKNYVMSSLLEEFKILDDDFKNVCMFLANNSQKILSRDLKDLYYSQNWSSLESDQVSPYVKRLDSVDDLPVGDFIEDKTVYFVKNPLPGAYYKYDLLHQTWNIDSNYSEMSPSEYIEYQKSTGHMIWETDSGLYQLIIKDSRRTWKKVDSGIPSKTVVRVADLPLSEEVGSIYKVTGEDILDILASYYGFNSPTFIPPWDQVMSEDGTKLTELLSYTLHNFFFISKDNFYEKNILNFIPAYDRDQMLEKPKIKLFMQGLGKKLDQLEDYMNSLENIYDLDSCPDELLDYIGQNLGYEKEDFTLSNLSFRELLKNIIEIYKVKGTNYSFSFFFKFLGFSINLKEFYFNRDVQNPEAFPGADEFKVEYYLSTTNPLYDTTTNKSVKNLGDIKNINDFETEKLLLEEAGCTNAINYMLGKETYNNEMVKMHSNPWTYFKTNLIEYALSPFLSKVNLTASDNETIKKYVRFLSPTYLFTWINVNLLPWTENFEINSETLLTEVLVTLGDPRPTPSPWPSHKPGEKGVPAHIEGTPFIKKTSSDVGFEGPYLNYEDVNSYFYIYSDKLEKEIPIYPLESLEISDIFGESILSYYIKNDIFYDLKELSEEQKINAMSYLKRKGIGFRDEAPFRLLRNPLYIYEQENIFIETQQYSILDFYNKGSSNYTLKNSLTAYEKLLAKKFMNIIHRIGDSVYTEIVNNMNLGGDDIVGTILKRDGSTVRQKDHPSYIVDITHKAVSRLGFDNLGIIINDSHNYSSKSFPSVPEKMSPFRDEIYFYSNNVRFEWDESYGAKNYRIQIARDYNFEDIIEQNVVNENFYISTNKFHNDYYYWRMKVQNTNEFDNKIIDNYIFDSYINRIAKKFSDGRDMYPPTTLEDKSFIVTMFEEVVMNGSSVGWKLKSDLTEEQINRVKDILFYVGFNWSPWSQVLKFDLHSIPFPYNGELIDRSTKYVEPVYYKLDITSPEEFKGVPVLFQWEKETLAIEYDLQVNDANYFEDDQDLIIFRTITTPEFLAGYEEKLSRYYIQNGTYYWRYRVKHETIGYKPWSDVMQFTVNFPETR